MAQLLSGESPFKQDLATAAHNSGAADTAKEILGPFGQISADISESVWDGFMPSAQTSSLHWLFLLGTLGLAIGLFILRKGRGAKGADGVERRTGLLDYILPKAIYSHLSARVDIGLYLLDRAFLPIWFIAFLGALAPMVESGTIQVLQGLFGASPELTASNGWLAVYGFSALLISDLVFYLTHLMMHKTRIGWAIHKVHHSAQVLTPLTRYREHFIAAPIWAAGAAIGLAFVAGIFAYLLAGELKQSTAVGVGVFSFLYAATANFRHYHVSLRFPRWLEYWLQSPGMHHTHHSYLEKHWDSNMGLFTSIWDRIFGTLYIAERYEETPWGLGQDEQAQYTTLAQNLITPFKEITNIILRRELAQLDSNEADKE